MPGADERRVAEVMGAIADRVCDQFQRPYTFPSFHERILQPYNYYDFGQARAGTLSRPVSARSGLLCIRWRPTDACAQHRLVCSARVVAVSKSFVSSLRALSKHQQLGCTRAGPYIFTREAAR